MQFQYSKFAVALLSAGILSSPAIANANDSNELEELRALVQELSQKVKVIERKDEINEEAAVAAKKETPVVKASANGFGLE
ncbi:MAG TPA: porin, partial [Methylotenera sp.]